MIKLIDLLVETKQDSLARIMTDDTIKSVKSFLSSNEEFNETNSWYKYHDQDLFCSSYVDSITPGEMKVFKMYQSKRVKTLISSKGFVVEGNAEVSDEPGVLIKIHLDSTKFNEGNLQSMQALYMDVLKVTRHEIEHIFQSNAALSTSGREKDMNRTIKPGLTGSAAMKDYRALPTEIEADAKAINLLKKKKKISFEEATKEFYQDFGLNKKDYTSLVSKMLKYAKKFNFGGY
jgi:hypothetical protein